MLDDFSREMDTTETKMDNVMKKMAKVLHMSSGMIWFDVIWFVFLFTAN